MRQPLEVAGQISIQGHPIAIDVSRDGRWIVATTRWPNTLTIIDANTQQVTSTVGLPEDGLIPMDVSISNDGQYAFTANWDGRASQAPHLFGGGRKPQGDTVSVIALASGQGSLIRSLPVGKYPTRIAAAPNGLVYVLADSPAPGPGKAASLWLIDGSQATVLKSRKWGREKPVVIPSYGHGSMAFSRNGLALLPTVATVEIVNTGTNQRQSNAGVVICQQADSIDHATGVSTSFATGVGFAVGYSVPYGDHHDASTWVARFGPDGTQVTMRARFNGLRSGPCLVSPDGTQLIVAVEPTERSADRDSGVKLLILETDSLTEIARLTVPAVGRLSQNPSGSLVLGVPPADPPSRRKSGNILVMRR